MDSVNVKIFKEIVASQDIKGVRTFMPILINGDESLNDYRQIKPLLEKIDNVWEVHNGDPLDTPSSIEEAKDELANQIGMLSLNFSKERISFIEKLNHRVYPESDIQNPVTKLNVVRKSKANITEFSKHGTVAKVGAVTAGVGAAGMIAGLIAGSTTVTIGAVVFIIGGATVYVIDPGL